MQKEDLLHFIQCKSQECFQHLDEPDQKEAFLYWMTMELICSKDAVSVVLYVVIFF